MENEIIENLKKNHLKIQEVTVDDRMFVLDSLIDKQIEYLRSLIKCTSNQEYVKFCRKYVDDLHYINDHEIERAKYSFNQMHKKRAAQIRHKECYIAIEAAKRIIKVYTPEFLR